MICFYWYLAVERDIRLSLWIHDQPKGSCQQTIDRRKETKKYDIIDHLQVSKYLLYLWVALGKYGNGGSVFFLEVQTASGMQQQFGSRLNVSTQFTHICVTPEVSPTLFCLLQYDVSIFHGRCGSHVGKCLPEHCHWEDKVR